MGSKQSTSGSSSDSEASLEPSTKACTSSPSNGFPLSFILASGQLYRFKSQPIGRFRIQGGTTSNAIIDGHQVTIRDASNGTQLFSKGGPKDRVTITDDPLDKTTTVSYIPRGALEKPPTREDIPFQAIAIPGHRIKVTGNRNVLITGNGGYLQVTGGGNVEFFGNPQSVSHSGTGNVIINGNCHKILNKGKGHLRVNGLVTGSISRRGGGTIAIHGPQENNAMMAGNSTDFANSRNHTHTDGNVTYEGNGVFVSRQR